MENSSYSSYPDSTNSSPRSRDVDETQSFDEFSSSTHNNNINSYKVKFMCSYGGKIQPRPHDNQLAYVGGDTKILAVDRYIKLSSLTNKLTSLYFGGGSGGGDGDHQNCICFKYQLPGEDLDALISVTNDEDLEHMMLEYDRLYRSYAKPARLRLFLFQLNSNSSFGSDDVKSERQWFVRALNSAHVQNNFEAAPPHTAEATAVLSAGNADFLFGSEEKNQKGDVAHEQVLNRKVEEVDSRAYGVEYYNQQPKAAEKIAPPLAAAQVSMPVIMQVPPPYYQEIHVTSGGGYQVPYNQAPTLTPVTGQVGQGYYGMQQQPVYNVVPPPQTAAVPSLQQQNKVGVGEQAYLQVGYDSAGRQVYYTTHAQPYHEAMVAPAATGPMVGLENRQGGGGFLNHQDGKV